MSRLLTIPQTASRLHVSQDAVRRLIASGKLPRVSIGRSVRIDPTDIDAFVASNKTGTIRGAAIDVFAPNPSYRPPAA